MERIHFEESTLWFEGARHIASHHERCSYTVASAMLIHAEIKANDALTWKFFKRLSRRHDDARISFKELIHRNCISSEYHWGEDVLQRAVSLKAKVEYKGTILSKREFDQLNRDAQRFLEMTKVTLDR